MSAMQNLNAFVNNDSAFSLKVTQSGYPLPLAPYTLKLYVKASQLALDSTATVYTIGSGLTYAEESAGIFTWDLPHSAATATGTFWWRVDLVDEYGNVGTALYGYLNIVGA
jgi:hypothetical protein